MPTPRTEPDSQLTAYEDRLRHQFDAEFSLHTGADFPRQAQQLCRTGPASVGQCQGVLCGQTGGPPPIPFCKAGPFDEPGGTGLDPAIG